MKKKITVLTLFVLTFILFSCNNNEDEIELNDFKGFYKIKSITSSLDVDLNNDGSKSSDYLQEIKSNYISYNGEIINYGYDNKFKQNFAIARPTENHTDNTRFLDISFPIQRIDSVYQGNNNYVKINTEYRKMGTGLIYKLINNNVEIESDPFNQFEYYDISNFEIFRVNKTGFETIFDFKVYDFTENKWIETKLKAKYEKVVE